MTPLEVLRDLVSHGTGLASVDGGLGVYPSSVLGSAITPALREAISARKSDLLASVDEGALRRTWGIPDETSVGPRLATILGWLASERESFTREETHRWREAKRRHIDDGASPYVADILATEAVAWARLDMGRAAA